MTNYEIWSAGRLTQLRVAQINASRPKVSKSGGTLDISCTFGISLAGEPQTRLAKLRLTVKGIPENDQGADPAFTIDLEVRGLYKFSSAIENTAFADNNELNALMCQPLFVFAVQRAESCFVDMGLRGIVLDKDLRTVGDVTPPNIDSSKSTEIVPRAAKSTKKKR